MEESCCLTGELGGDDIFMLRNTPVYALHPDAFNPSPCFDIGSVTHFCLLHVFFFHFHQYVQISFQHSQTCHRAEDHPRPLCLFPSTRFFLLFPFFNSHRTHLIPHPAISLHTYRPSSSDMAQLPLSPSPAPTLVYSHLCAHDVFGIVPWWRLLCQS